MPQTVRVGSVAPELLLRGVGGQPLSATEARGRPRGLAFVRGWSTAHVGDEDLRAMRAELRAGSARPRR